MNTHSHLGMQPNLRRGEVVSGIALSVLSENPERLAMLQNRLDAAGVCQTVLSHPGFPAQSTDSIIRRLQDTHTEVVVIDIEPHNIHRAASAIEVIEAATNGVIVLAIGNLEDPGTIVTAMRAGAREFLDRNPDSDVLAQSLSRLASTRSRTRVPGGRARLITVASAKGGAGGTTVAVNLASAIQTLKGSVLLVDLAKLGHAALHLNVHPNFGVIDALQNLHRLDTSLLDGLIISCKSGLKLLAGTQKINPVQVTSAELAHLMEQLSSRYDYLVVDASGRTDQTLRSLAELSTMVLLVTQTDVASLWSASRLQTFIEPVGEGKRVHLVLNRFRKIPGLTDEDVERLTNCHLLWKVPSNYHAVAASLDKGIPLASQRNNDIAESMRLLAEKLTSSSEGGLAHDLTLTIGRPEVRKSGRNFLISALRTGQ